MRILVDPYTDSKTNQTNIICEMFVAASVVGLLFSISVQKPTSAGVVKFAKWRDEQKLVEYLKDHAEPNAELLNFSPSSFVYIEAPVKPPMGFLWYRKGVISLPGVLSSVIFISEPQVLSIFLKAATGIVSRPHPVLKYPSVLFTGS